MKKQGFAAGLCTLCLAGVASAAPQMPAPTQASLRVMDTTPVTVRGWGFEARERVSLVLNAGGDMDSAVRLTSDAGVLLVRFDETLGSCERLTVRAWGSRGSRARLLAPRYQVGCTSTGRGTHASPTG